MPTNRMEKNHAIVIGAGIAGLFAAKILSKYFSQVTIIEKDLLPSTAEVRMGTAQSLHLHVFLKRGLDIATELFPGIHDTLLERGGIPIDWAKDTFWLNPMGWAPRYSSEVISCSCSRWLLEFTIREYVEAISNVSIQSQTQITNLLWDEKKVIGVVCKVADKKEEIQSDLVVDCSGRGSRLPDFLVENGFPQVKESIVSANLGYASCHYEIPESFSEDWKQLYIQMKPPHFCRGGVLYPIENNRWIVTLVGANKDYPPGTKDGFLEFAQSLRDPLFFDTIVKAKPLSKVYCHRRTENRLRHYEQLRNFPIGIIALGDSICAFNPVYGQGMTVAAMSASVLDNCLARYDKPQKFSQMFRKMVAKNNSISWLISTSEDYRVPSATGKINIKTRLIHYYFDKVLLCCLTNRAIHRKFLGVLHMIEPVTSLVHPKVILTKVKK